MWGATSTLGPLPCWAAVMRSVIGDSFLKAANAQLAVVVLSRKPLRVPVQRSAHRPPALVPLTNPNERRSRACSPAKAPPTPAGTRVVANPARARRRSRETHPGPPGLPMPRPSLGGRPWPDSSVTAANWPPVPTSPGGRQPTPKDRAALAPDGGTEAGGAARPSLPVSSGPVAVDAPLRENHADPRVHCALS